MKSIINDTDETVFSLNQDTIEMLTEIANPTLISLTLSWRVLSWCSTLRQERLLSIKMQVKVYL
jgi:hypothetical protein